MAYIAAKNVKFDRAYSIGEPIPDAVIDPGRVKSLIEMGRIMVDGSLIGMGRIQINTPDDQSVPEPAQEPQEERGEPEVEDKGTEPEEENEAPEPAQEPHTGRKRKTSK